MLAGRVILCVISFSKSMSRKEVGRVDYVSEEICDSLKQRTE